MSSSDQTPEDHSEQSLDIVLPSSIGRVSAQSALKKNSAKVNIWFFQSPKNSERLIIAEDLPFMKAVLLEGDPDVIGYDIKPDPLSVRVGNRDVMIRPAMHIFTQSGPALWIDFMRQEEKSRRSKRDTPNQNAEYAAQRNIPYQIITDTALRKKQVLFENWIMLCAAINRCKGLGYQKILKTVFEQVKLQNSTTLKSLLSSINEEPALVLAAVALGLQKGVFSADLDNALFGSESPIRG